MIFAGDTARLKFEELTTLQVLKENSGTAITAQDFAQAVELGSFLEDGDTLEDLVREDPETSFYSMSLADGTYLGLRNCGVDRLFSHDGNMPRLDFGLDSSINEQCRRSQLAWVLAPCGSLLANGPMGDEVQTFKTSKLARFDGSKGSTRLQLLHQGEAVCGLQIKNNTVETLYTDSNWHRQGMASRLMNHAHKLFPDLQISQSRTSDGKAFFDGYQARRRTSPNRSVEPEPL